MINIKQEGIFDMVSEKSSAKKNDNATQQRDETKDHGAPEVFLSSKQEVADELKMSLRQFSQLLRKYPFNVSGVPGKIMGRWRVTRTDVCRWFRYVQSQEARHPDARRMRPEEAPEIAVISGR